MESSLQDLQQIFEYELKRKLAERAKTSSGEFRVLLNGFRFFDINYTGIITKAQWIQGILRTGLTGFSESDLDSLFILYDVNNTGQIDYKNFCSFLYGREPLNPLTNNSQSLLIEQNNNNYNNNQETNMNMNNQNIQNNYNNTPRRNYNNNYNNIKRETPFINNNQYNIITNQRRQVNSPNNYFNNNENDNFGYNIRTPVDNYEYQENTNFRRSQRKVNSYNSTYNNIFQQESNQSNFIKRNNNYNLSESAINSIIMSIRNNININNGIKLFTFIKNLKMRESNNSQISINDLFNLFQEMRINVPYEDLKILFNYANKNDNDILSTDQLINIIKGTLDEQRKLYIIEVFSKIDTEQKKKISIQLLKNMFNAKKHPEVINGTKSKEEILEQFCYSLDLYCEINGIEKNGELSFENFIDYYSCVSASIPDEVYFEDMINGVWSDNKNINNNQNQNINSNNNSDNNNYNNISNNQKINDINQNNMNNVIRGTNNERKNDIQNNNSNLKNNINNNINDNNVINNMNPINYGYGRKIKNSMSSPFVPDNNQNNQMRNNNYNRNINNNNINNNIQSPYNNYQNKENTYNRRQIAVPRGIDNFQNKNKRRYNPILDEYYPEIQNFNNNEISKNDTNSKNILSKNNYQRNLNQNMNNISIVNSKDIQNKENVNQEINNSNRTNSNPLMNLQNVIISRGPKSIFTFQRMLAIYDRNNSGFISLNDFINIFQIYNLNISDAEIKNIFDIYDQNQTGTISYSILINDLIGQMNEKRTSLVEKVFNIFNKNEKGEVSLKEIKQAYNPGKHPDVLNGKKSPNEVFGDFLDMLEIFREYIYNIKGGYITSINLEDFKQFYSEISLSIKDDYIFENMMLNCWNIGSYNNNGFNRNNESGNNCGYDRNIRARTGQQIMNMNNRGY